MDLRYFAGRLLLKTELGKNLSILPARLDKLYKVSESVTLSRLLSFSDNSIENLYTFDPENNIFRLEHQDGDYLARATAVVNPFGVRFKAEFVENNLTEFGISYVGFVRIRYQAENFDIRLPGELSFDPACIHGDKMWVDFHQVTKIVVFVAVLVKAALLGASKKFLKRIYTVSQPIIARYYQKEELFRWIYKQVKCACVYKKAPLSYAEHLQKTKKRCSEAVLNYLSNLDMLKKGEIQEILPPLEFFKGINEELDVAGVQKPRLSDTEDIKLLMTSDFEENTVPSIKEMLELLEKGKFVYETQLSYELNKIQDLVSSTNSRKTIFKISADKSFTSQCPIF
jgi:hypothetical protein